MGWIEFDSVTGDPLLDCDWEHEMQYRRECREREAKKRAQELKDKRDPCMYLFAVCSCSNCERRWKYVTGGLHGSCYALNPDGNCSHFEGSEMAKELKYPTERHLQLVVDIKRDGDVYCATKKDFINLQESPAGFGDMPIRALENLHMVSTWSEDDLSFATPPDSRVARGLIEKIRWFLGTFMEGDPTTRSIRELWQQEADRVESQLAEQSVEELAEQACVSLGLTARQPVLEFEIMEDGGEDWKMSGGPLVDGLPIFDNIYPNDIEECYRIAHAIAKSLDRVAVFPKGDKE